MSISYSLKGKVHPSVRVRGLISNKNRCMLTLHGCVVDILCRGYGTQVHLQVEYVNDTGSNQTITALYPMPHGWILRECWVAYDGRTVRATYGGRNESTTTDADAVPLTAITPTPDPDALATVSQPLPFVVQVGTAAVMHAVYYVPSYQNHPLRRSSFMRLELPSLLFPLLAQPPGTAQGCNKMFAMLHPRRALPNEFQLNVSAELPMALRGSVGLERVEDARVTVLKCTTEYTGDSCFKMQYTAHLEEMCNPHCPASLLLTCFVQSMDEPLRIFVEKDVGDAVAAEDKVAGVVYFTPPLHRAPANAEVILVCDAHNVTTMEAMAQALRLALHNLPPSVYLNVVLLQDDKDICVYSEGSVAVGAAPLDQIAALVATAAPQKPLHGGSGKSHLPNALHGLMTRTGPCAGGPGVLAYVRHIVIISDEAGTEDLTSTIAAAGEVADAMYHHDVRISAVALSQPPLAVHSVTGLGTLQLFTEVGGGMFELAEEPAALPGALVQVLAACAVPTLAQVEVLLTGSEGVRSALLWSGRGSNSNLLAAAVPLGFQQLIFFLAPAEERTLSLCITGKVGSMVFEYTASCDCNAAMVEQCRQKKEVEASTGVGDGREDVALSAGLLHVAAATARLRAINTVQPHGSTAGEVERLSRVFSLPTPTRFLSTSIATASRMAPTYTARAHTLYLRLLTLRAHIVMQRAAAPPPTSLRVNKQLGVWPTQLAAATLSTWDYLRAVVKSVVEVVLEGPGVERLPALQTASGSFLFNTTLSVCVGVPYCILEKELPPTCISTEAWATLLAMTAMQTASRRTTLLAERAALQYLDGQYPDGSWRDWIAQARSALSAATRA